MSRQRNGFTLMELLVVVVIVGLLAAVALPRFSATRNKAKLATVKSDIRAIQAAQEGHYSNWNQYGNLNQLTNRMKLGLSAGNTATVTGNNRTYTATVTNASITTGFKACTFTYGGNSANNGKLICS